MLHNCITIQAAKNIKVVTLVCCFPSKISYSCRTYPILFVCLFGPLSRCTASLYLANSKYFTFQLLHSTYISKNSSCFTK